MNRVKAHFTLLILAIGVSHLWAGCASGLYPDADTLTAAAEKSPQAQNAENAAFNQKILSKARINTDPSDYLLGAGDLLNVTVFGSEELNTKARVSSRGYITLPLIGQVAVKGRSAREAETHIENLYRTQYLRNPNVNVFVEEHFSQRVTLVGQFHNPGTYDYISKMRLLDVMALAGGLNDKAGRTAQIRRYGEPGEQTETIIVDLDKLIREGESNLNIEINGGDVVFVPDAGTFFVDGAVRKPGAFTINQTTSVREALSFAGGLAPYADTDGILLVRHLKGGEREVKELDMDDLAIHDTPIGDRDIIIVKINPMGQFLHGLGINIGIPGLGFGYRDPVR